MYHDRIEADDEEQGEEVAKDEEANLGKIYWHSVEHLTTMNLTHKIIVEEVPVKWMDRPSATEMERGRASEMDKRKSAKKKMVMPLT